MQSYCHTSIVSQCDHTLYLTSSQKRLASLGIIVWDSVNMRPRKESFLLYCNTVRALGSVSKFYDVSASHGLVANELWCHGQLSIVNLLSTFWEILNILRLFFRCWNQLYPACLKDTMYQIKIQTLLEPAIPRFMRNSGNSCKCFWRKSWPWQFQPVQTSLLLFLNQIQYPTGQVMLKSWESFTKCIWSSPIWVNCMPCTYCGHHNQKIISIVFVFKHFHFRKAQTAMDGWTLLGIYSVLIAYIIERKILKLMVGSFIYSFWLSQITYTFFFSTIANWVWICIFPFFFLSRWIAIATSLSIQWAFSAPIGFEGLAFQAKWIFEEPTILMWQCHYIFFLNINYMVILLHSASLWLNFIVFTCT